jgi:glycine oxidase
MEVLDTCSTNLGPAGFQGKPDAMSSPDVVIVGGGVIGAACARALAIRGVRVTVLDAGPQPGAATPASAGILAPLADTHGPDPLLGLRVRARDLYRELAPVLEDETGTDIGLWTEGITQVAFSAEHADRLKTEIAWQRQQGFPVDWLDADELRQRHPGINPNALGGHLSPEDGALEPLALREALRRSATARGALWLTGQRATSLHLEGQRALGVNTTAGRLEAGAVLLAAGCWSGRLGGLPRPLSVEPVRGQMAALPWPPGEPRAVVFGEQGYVSTRSGEAICGSTVEHAGFDPAVTEEGIAQILASARRLYPALERIPETRRWAGLRPATPDGQPLIGPDPAVANLWYATGHGRNGILLAAITGEILASLLLGQPVEFDLAPVSPARFWTA